MTNIRMRWAAIGAAVAVSVGAGGVGLVSATIEDGPKPVYTAIDPCRILDTRPEFPVGGVQDDAPLDPGDVVTVNVHANEGECEGIPNDVTSVEMNVTAVGATEQTHFTIWAGDPGDVPNASSLNPEAGARPKSNAVTTDLNQDGEFNLFNLQGEVHAVIDIVGILQDHNHNDLYYTKDQSEALTVLAHAGDGSDVSFPNVAGGFDVIQVQTVALTAPDDTPGAMLVQGGGDLVGNGNTVANGRSFACWISTDPNSLSSNLGAHVTFAAGSTISSNVISQSFSTTTAVEVAAGESVDLFLLCRDIAGQAGNSFRVSNGHLSATFMAGAGHSIVPATP